jgi:hypothetical protein
MYWFWLNVPLAAVFFGAWYGIPMWLVCKRPGWGSAPLTVTGPASGRQTGPAAVAAPASEHLAGVS